ncbi:hypothetical protein FEM48_Zijuj04G0103800 [Ziziphus jujuba var. spinosa]|uniref:Agenet domain-containing protein n=1 Tax=Ziziphus jujuba var. spinosa TaxID=714518 RepID=A0A978VJC0_ZIZJJ|nr:hypothetical protein FEM48_Zijuj04G0103800 [Ziziphus jujuba var. spinosa]
MDFCKGQEAEKCNKQEGFVGLYYEPIVVSLLDDLTYVVEYKEILESDESGLLVEKVSMDELRPKPPQIRAVDLHTKTKWMPLTTRD